jgi:hypothetical protein
MIEARLKTSPSSTPLIIDLDIEPFIPDGWKVEEHQKGGSFKWDASYVSLHLSDKQKNGKWLELEGNKLRKELVGKSVLNANVLDYLLAHPNVIPEEWKGKYVFFWGTVYRYSDDRFYVRCLFWDRDRWDWDCRWLGRSWRDFPAALNKLPAW